MFGISVLCLSVVELDKALERYEKRVWRRKHPAAAKIEDAEQLEERAKVEQRRASYAHSCTAHGQIEDEIRLVAEREAFLEMIHSESIDRAKVLKARAAALRLQAKLTE